MSHNKIRYTHVCVCMCTIVNHSTYLLELVHPTIWPFVQTKRVRLSSEIEFLRCQTSCSIRCPIVDVKPVVLLGQCFPFHVSRPLKIPLHLLEVVPPLDISESSVTSSPLSSLKSFYYVSLCHNDLWHRGSWVYTCNIEYKVSLPVVKFGVRVRTYKTLDGDLRDVHLDWPRTLQEVYMNNLLYEGHPKVQTKDNFKSSLYNTYLYLKTSVHV